MNPDWVGIFPGPQERGHDLVNGRLRWLAGSIVSLAFLAPLPVAILRSEWSAWQMVAALADLAAFLVCYAAGVGWAFGHPRRVPLVLVTLGLLTVPLILSTGAGVVACWVYLGVASAMLLPSRIALGIGILLGVAGLFAGLLDGTGLQWELALVIIGMTGFTVAFAANLRLNRELQRTRHELAVAAVAAERARIGRDLHDILGHSLTAISVKASLAGRLLDRRPDDPEPIRAEIADLQRLAREALADVRATAGGYRELSLAGELALAGSVLAAAGIGAQLPTAVDDVNPLARKVFGYVVREAVTNVVRHSGASRAVITLTPDTVTVIDNGGGMPAGDAEGSGLRGLADRVAAAGGDLRVGRGDEGGVRVTATVPAETGRTA